MLACMKPYVPKNTLTKTAIPSLSFAHYEYPVCPLMGLSNPSFSLIIQGEKETYLPKETFTQNPGDYLISSIGLPLASQITSASPNTPYLELKLEFTSTQILDVIHDALLDLNIKKSTKRGIYLNNASPLLLDAITRLVNLLSTPEDIPILAPLFTKEIIYRLLREPNGNQLAQIALEGSPAYQMNEAIEYITNHYNQPFKIEDLAKVTNLSTSSLHRQFKAVTSMSPIQFQKQLRLQKARQLLLCQPLDVTQVAYHVGYESSSQFSREYSRMFGLPPKKDIQQLKAQSQT